MYNSLDFHALPGLASPHLQTIMAVFGQKGAPPPSQKLLVALEDGDQLSCQVSIPPGWNEQHKTIALIHGLGGSHESNYIVRMSRRLHAAGRKVVRINLRGCGSGKGLAYLPYNAGTSLDIYSVLQELKKQAPKSPITLIGYSLGGNIALKLAGELGDTLCTYCDRIIAVCPPVDLFHTVQALTKGFNRFYERYYLGNLLKQSPHWVMDQRIDSLHEFDDKITALAWGYDSAEDYYDQSSAIRYASSIKQRCDILFSADDPIIDYHRIEKAMISPYTTVWLAKGGGHNGFLGWAGNNGIYWLDNQIYQWISSS